MLNNFEKNLKNNQLAEKQADIIPQFPNPIKITLDYGTENNYTDKNNLNWRDDDMSYKDTNNYFDGYKNDPYMKFKGYRLAQRIKKAYTETRELDNTPEGLAKEIIYLWKQVDGPLQNLFEGFTLRFTNKEKEDIAKILKDMGYEVKPVILDETKRYASSDVFEILSNKYNNDQLVELYSKKFNSRAINKVNEVIKLANFENKKVALKDINNLLSYYSQLYSEDLVATILSKNLKYKNTNTYEKGSLIDDQFSRLMTDEIRNNLLSGNNDPIQNTSPTLMGPTDYNYDRVSDMRVDTIMAKKK